MAAVVYTVTASSWSVAVAMVVVRNAHAKLDTIDSRGNVPIQNLIRLFHFSYIGICGMQARIMAVEENTGKCTRTPR